MSATERLHDKGFFVEAALLRECAEMLRRLEWQETTMVTTTGERCPAIRCPVCGEFQLSHALGRGIFHSLAHARDCELAALLRRLG